MKRDDLLLPLFIGIVGYVVYQKIFGKGGPTDKVAKMLADWYVRLTTAGVPVPTGAILLPDGNTYVAVADVMPQNVSGTNSATFTYQGVTYYLNTPHDANGNWAASLTLGS